MNIHRPITIKDKPGGFVSPKHISKDWGYELIFHNGSYCMKVLQLNPQSICKRHLHLSKGESMYIAEGSVTIYYEDGKRNKFQQNLTKGECFTIPPGMPHSLQTMAKSCTIVEASTFHEDSDSIRI